MEELKNEVLAMSLNSGDDGQQKRLIKIVVTTMIDIADSLRVIANKP